MPGDDNSTDKFVPVVERVDSWRAASLVVGLTSGVWDLLHDGHLSYLARARDLVDRLVVGVDTDALVRERKRDNRPFDSQNDRVRAVAATGFADAIFSKSGSLDAAIARLRFDVLIYPSGKQLSDERHRMLVERDVGAVALPTTPDISTTKIARHRGLTCD